MKTLKNPGPQWDKAAQKLAALCAAGDSVALTVASKNQSSVEGACRYFAGEKSPEGRLASELESLVWWDETMVDDGKTVVPWTKPDYSQVDVPGGWKSDD